MKSITLTSDKGVVMKFESKVTGRKLLLAYDKDLKMQYALLGKHNFKDFGTVRQASDIFRLHQWLEGAIEIR